MGVARVHASRVCTKELLSVGLLHPAEWALEDVAAPLHGAARTHICRRASQAAAMDHGRILDLAETIWADVTVAAGHRVATNIPVGLLASVTPAEELVGYGFVYKVRWALEGHAMVLLHATNIIVRGITTHVRAPNGVCIVPVQIIIRTRHARAPSRLSATPLGIRRGTDLTCTRDVGGVGLLDLRRGAKLAFTLLRRVTATVLIYGPALPRSTKQFLEVFFVDPTLRAMVGRTMAVLGAALVIIRCVAITPITKDLRSVRSVLVPGWTSVCVAPPLRCATCDRVLNRALRAVAIDLAWVALERPTRCALVSTTCGHGLATLRRVDIGADEALAMRVVSSGSRHGPCWALPRRACAFLRATIMEVGLLAMIIAAPKL
mmetsp:Transcript_131301/g.340051  ORF Transcript_131301/g.340051 Transcript_131301/m.340051 type:complete len:377 (+) Transcript_131301:2308-3438(+)